MSVWGILNRAFCMLSGGQKCSLTALLLLLGESPYSGFLCP